MERRLVIKQVLIMAGGMVLLPSCLRQTGKSTILLKKISIDLDQENLLAEIAETIIPATDTPGAKELKLHLFALKMLDDCYEVAEQDQFMEGLKEFSKLVRNRFSTSFEKLNPQQRLEVLSGINTSTKTDSALTLFYRIWKEQTIKGYLNSKYVMTNLVIYELVPGRYNGYYPVKTA
ncbi:gluconate 2-dehydrogenase subunit 3 family protein [Pedobacter sp. AW31-3R]|uniref:gluconate 2-dehydrogenase subunit 3 family protein n=1 Tax=Pedobacter sp. AW31-3R TaxID=3445781 RepID=UPI003FA0516A